MKLFDMPLEAARLQHNSDDFAVVRQIAESGNNHPVLMLNMNRYTPESGFPDHSAYYDYISTLGPFLEGAGARLLRRFPVFGQAVGDQKIDEILACWYLLHWNFLELYGAPGAVKNFRRKGVCVEYAVIHRCPGDRSPFAPSHGRVASDIIDAKAQVMATSVLQAPGFQRHKIGDVVVTARNDGFIILPPDVLRGIGAEEQDALYRAAGRRPPFATAINGYLLQWPGRTVLIDAGAGGFMGPYVGKLQANLIAAGITPADVDTVLLTHMHTDHIGGLLAPDWTALFPRAEVIVSVPEIAYWRNRSNQDSSPETTRDAFDVSANVVAAYGDRFATFDRADVTPKIKAIALPGHTPATQDSTSPRTSDPSSSGAIFATHRKCSARDRMLRWSSTFRQRMQSKAGAICWLAQPVRIC